MNTKLPYCVYVLYSERDHMTYVGYTSDILRRTREHENGLNVSTSHRGPFQLIFIEYYLFKDDAIKREKYLKTTPGRKTLSVMLATTIEKLKLKSNHGKANTFIYHDEDSTRK